MIDYSVYLQTNFLKPEAGERAYAKAQVREVWNGDRFVKHLADHNGVFSRGTVKGVVSDLCKCLVEQVLNGNKVYLGELGCFSVSLSCESADTMEKFNEDNIKAVNLVFTPGDDFINMIGKTTFNRVASRAAQLATLKAEKAGEATVDLAAAKGGSSTTDEPSTGTGDTGNTDDTGNSGSGNSGTSGEDSNPL